MANFRTIYNSISSRFHPITLLLFIWLIGFNGLVNAQQFLLPQIPPVDFRQLGPIAPGYTFMVPFDLSTTNLSYPTSMMVLNEAGETVFFRPHSISTAPPFTPKFSGDPKLLPSGELSMADLAFGQGIGIFIMDSTLAITDTCACKNGYVTDGHGFQKTPDGHYHLLCEEVRILDMSAFVTESGQQGSPVCQVTGHIIQELGTDKSVIREWKALDHFDLADLYTESYFLDSQAVRHQHINSLFVDSAGNYLISSRHLNEISSIDRLSGQFLWRFGGKNNQFTLVNDSVLFTGQHDATFLPNGNLLLFDNGQFKDRPETQVREFGLNHVDGTATQLRATARPGNYLSFVMGSAQGLDNGHVFVGWGGGNAPPLAQVATEYDASGTPVLEIRLPAGYVSYTFRKYELPWQFPQPSISCTSGNQLQGPAGFEHYHWSTGDTTPNIVVSDTGTYALWVENEHGFFFCSPYIVTDSLDPCGVISSIHPQPSPLQFTVYPNPATHFFKIQSSLPTDFTVSIWDVQGRNFDVPVDYSAAGAFVKTQDLLPGIYLIRIHPNGQAPVFRKVIKL